MVKIISSLNLKKTDKVYPDSDEYYMKVTAWGWDDNTGKNFEDVLIAKEVRQIITRRTGIVIEPIEAGMMVSTSGAGDLTMNDLQVKHIKPRKGNTLIIKGGKKE